MPAKEEGRRIGKEQASGVHLECTEVRIDPAESDPGRESGVVCAAGTAVDELQHLGRAGGSVLERERDAFWLDGVVIALMNLRGWERGRGERGAEEVGRRGDEREGVLRENAGVDRGSGCLWTRRRTMPWIQGMLRRMEEDFEEAKYIHLVRHPYGMIPSFENAKLQVFYPPFLKGESGDDGEGDGGGDLDDEPGEHRGVPGRGCRRRDS